MESANTRASLLNDGANRPHLVSGVCGELGGHLVVVWWDGSLGGYLVWWNGRVSSGIGGYLSGRISSYILNRK